MRNFPFLKYSARPRTLLKSPVWRFNTREYNYIRGVLNWPPPPILGQGEPPQGVFLRRRPIFQIFSGCHITLKSLILIIFSLPVNYLFLPLLDDIKKAYRTNLQTEKNHAHAKALKYETLPISYHFLFCILACAIIIISRWWQRYNKNISTITILFVRKTKKHSEKLCLFCQTT